MKKKLFILGGLALTFFALGALLLLANNKVTNLTQTTTKATTSQSKANSLTTHNSNKTQTTPKPSSEINITLTADDYGADQTNITVNKGALVNLTLKVAPSNYYYGGLEFISTDPPIDTGTVHSGQSKTIQFTASKSFVIQPYWPEKAVKKDYTININVNQF